jgi:phage terminase small subunit
MDAYMLDIATYDKAVAAKLRKKPAKPTMPNASGGVGFEVRRDPHPDCPNCIGEGHTRVTAQDTTKLSPQARKLFKGVKAKPDGTIEILMHDQMQARDMIIKMLGAYKDPKQATPVIPGEARDIPEDATPEQAQAAYLTLVKS